MTRISLMLLGALLTAIGLPAAHAKNEPAKEAGKKTAAPYDGFDADRALLRKHLIHKAKDGGRDTRYAAANRSVRRVSDEVHQVSGQQHRRGRA